MKFPRSSIYYLANNFRIAGAASNLDLAEPVTPREFTVSMKMQIDKEKLEQVYQSRFEFYARVMAPPLFLFRAARAFRAAAAAASYTRAASQIVSIWISRRWKKHDRAYEFARPADLCLAK